MDETTDFYTDAAEVGYNALFGDIVVDAVEMPAETVGIRKHPSYNHNVSSQGQAESELKQYCPTDGKCYFTWWEDSRKAYTLSVSEEGRFFRHINVIAEGEGFELEGGFACFNDMTSMLKYYENSSIGDIDGIGEPFRPIKKSISHPEKGRGSGLRRNEKSTGSLRLKHGWNYQDDEIFKQERLSESAVVGFEIEGVEAWKENSSSTKYAKAIPIEHIREMKGHPSFHGTISTEEAELLLRKRKRNCYLTRYDNGMHILSVMAVSKEDGRTFQHFQLMTHSQNGCYEYEIDGSGNKFAKVSMLLDFYQCNPLNYIVTSIGECGPYYRRGRTDTDSGDLVESQHHPTSHDNGLADNLNPAANHIMPQKGDVNNSHNDVPASMSCIRPPLCERDLKLLRNFLYDVRLKWYDIGVELDISPADLDVIKKKNHDDPGDCLREMLWMWLKFVDNRPNWNEIAKALTTKVINELALANKAKKNVEDTDMFHCKITMTAGWLKCYKRGF